MFRKEAQEDPCPCSPSPLAAAALAGEPGFDHGHAAFAAVLDGAVSDAGVDYGLIAKRRPQLDAYLAELADAPAADFTDPQRLALYVNAYNALTIATILDAGQPASIRDIDGGNVWDKRHFTVAGESVTLNDLEHRKARKLADGRIHAALNCASKGCPPLPPAPLSAARDLGAQLDEDARHWARTTAFHLEGDTVAVSKIFDWYGEDFAGVQGDRDLPKVDGKLEHALWFLSRYADPAVASKLTSGTVTASWQDYDWSLNRR
ncbi:MAG: DUF547 domain-containing protein [Myxococcota bacterium]